jgi:hypothetical protein
MALNLFRQVAFQCVDAERLQRLYQDSQNAIATEVVFAEKVALPELPGVQQAYLGLLPATEFLRLIENSDQEMLLSLFFDNVRHWQEWNAVNTEIRDTLQDEEKRGYFPLLNNGVTIVAKKLSSTGNKMLVEDYQVVNGCQTSFVLHESRDLLDEGIRIPVRLIATDNADIRNSIIKATNRQTQVTEEQLVALLDFARKLEVYFPTFDGKRKLLFERRPRQYNAMPGVEKVRIITVTALVRAFASMFLGSPHRTTRNYNALLALVGTQIFGKDHRLEPYYTAAYAQYRLEFLFRSGALPSDLKPARYHLLLAYRVLAGVGDLPQYLNSGDMTKYCSGLMDTLWDEDVSRAYFEQAADLVRQVAAGDMSRDNIHTERFTRGLVELIGRSR